MKKLLALCLAIACVVVQAQPKVQPTGTQTSPNLVYTTKNPWGGPAGTEPYTWSGFVNTQSQGGGISGGDVPGYNGSVGQFMFGYQQGTVAYNYAVSQALKNSGMTWLGYNYAWEYFNQDFSRGSLSASVAFNSISGTVLHSRNWNLGPTTQGWTAVNGTETFVNPLAVSNINSFNLSFTGQDDRFWAGYYGPQVRNPSISVLYTFDQCYANPLSSPECPGYAQALLDQQCTANPLYSTSCPGYAAAYQTQQCTINPLYSAQCPGYQVAYFNQQCTANPLYATTCPGYAEAYKTQQCTADPLSATDCPGYAQAYLNSQCIKDSLYSRLCSGYATAYAIKYLAPLDSTTSTAVNSSLSATAAVKAMDPVSVNTNGTVSTTPSATGDSTVDAVIAAPGTTSVTSTTSVTNPPPPPPGAPGPTANAAPGAAPPPPPLAQQQERAAENKKTDTAVASVERKSGGNAEAARKEATAQAKELANNISKAATLEAQAANQGLVVGLMAYVPGFSAYQNAIVPDTLGAQVTKQYSKPTVDNRSAQRQLSGSNEIRWREMVDSQYRGK